MAAHEQNLTESDLTEKQLRAVSLVAADELTDVQISEEVGISRGTLHTWKKSEPFRAAVKSCIEEHESEIMRIGIAQRGRRLEAQGHRWRLMKQVIAERAKDPAMKDIPGGGTGLIVRQLKGVGRGEDFQLVEEFAVDTGLLRELREIEKQAAQEAGQWVDKIAPTDPTGTREFSELTEVERAERIAAILNAARARGAGSVDSGAEEVGAATGTTDNSSGN